MTLKNCSSSWKRGWLPGLVLLSSFLYLLAFSWHKWGDLVIDTGRELDVPMRLASGEMLYRDVFYLYGPFSPYFHALLFKIFGLHTNVLAFSGALAAMLTAILVYKISRFFLTATISLIPALTFLFVFAFGHYVYLGNYNFILPFSYPAVHSILFSLASFFFSIIF